MFHEVRHNLAASCSAAALFHGIGYAFALRFLLAMAGVQKEFRLPRPRTLDEVCFTLYPLRVRPQKHRKYLSTGFGVLPWGFRETALLSDVKGVSFSGIL